MHVRIVIILIAGPRPEINKLTLPNKRKISVLRDQFHAKPTLPPLPLQSQGPTVSGFMEGASISISGFSTNRIDIRNMPASGINSQNVQTDYLQRQLDAINGLE